MVISVDRYLSVVWSHRFPPSKPRTIVFIAITWAIAIGSSFPSLFEVVSEISYTQTSHSCAPDWKENCSYYTILNIIIYAVIVPAMVFCYVGVFLKVWRQQELLRSNDDKKPSVVNTSILERPVEGNDDNSDDYGKDIPTDGNGRQNEGTTSLILTPENSLDCSKSSSTDKPVAKHVKGRTKKDTHQEIMTRVIKNKNHRVLQKKLNIEKRVALTGTLLVLTTLVCWAPYCIVRSCVLSIRVPHWLVVAAVWLGYSNSLLDPLIYTFMNRRTGPLCRFLRR
ncbi:5-hydroxytryptamine receptor 1-like [Lytechinus variegatus]|uniref:5-hydroxytryptamine receptor 1-like n=1 Tax=Lytechinus variegatus TaxID=7654 RepID=UPI001BB29A56|nr:5-hydroxytryptamine receptor 1-like [Lytechinus variegatus]